MKNPNLPLPLLVSRIHGLRWVNKPAAAKRDSELYVHSAALVHALRDLFRAGGLAVFLGDCSHGIGAGALADGAHALLAARRRIAEALLPHGAHARGEAVAGGCEFRALALVAEIRASATVRAHGTGA